MTILPLHKIPSKVEAERILRELVAKGMVCQARQERMAKAKG